MTTPGELSRITAEDLDSVGRAWAHTIGRSADQRVEDYANIPAVAAAVRQYSQGVPWTRHDLLELLAEHADHRARTAIVFAWGGSRGNHHKTVIVLTGVTDETTSPRGWASYKWDAVRDLRARPDPVGAANELLWTPTRSLYHKQTSALVATETAFDKLWNRTDRSQGLLPGCGTSFGTKILYWAARLHTGDFGRSLTGSALPLIYDIRVAQALSDLTWSSNGSSQRFPRPDQVVPFLAYRAYCDLAQTWAEDLNRHARSIDADGGFVADDIELWLFSAPDAFDQRPTEGLRGRASRHPAGGPEVDDPGGRDDDDAGSEERRRRIRLLRALRGDESSSGRADISVPPLDDRMAGPPPTRSPRAH